MKKNFTLIIICFLSTLSTVFAQNTLRIENPLWWGDQSYGVIEDATITFRPEGAYFETEIILTIAASNSYYTDENLLEIILDFNLPKGAIVHDSWLWMPDGETIVKADILDISSAIEDYEAIVIRQTDPSILFQNGDSYQIRVYPLLGDGVRKFKITYLSPANWDENTVSTWFPTGILQTSNSPIESVKIITFPNDTWKNPRLDGLPFNQFASVSGTNSQPILMTEISNYDLDKPIKFSVDSPLSESNVFASQYSNGIDNFYQIAYMPQPVEIPVNPKKILLLYDYEENNSQIKIDNIMAYLSKELSSHLTPNDQVNVLMSSGSTTQLLFEEWVNSDTPSLTESISMQPYLAQSNNSLIELLTAGIQVTKGSEDEVHIFLMSNSDNLSWNVGNEGLTTLIELIGEDDIHIHIVDYQTENFHQLNWNSNTLSSINYNFYNDLTRATSGSFYSTIDDASHVWESIEFLCSSIYNYPHNFELHTSLDNGFSFDRFQQNSNGQSIGPNKPIVQIGKFVGELPFKVNYSAFVNGAFISEGQTIAVSETNQADTLLREIWMGNYLPTMESFSSTQEIVNLSIEERILTPYTAFLALDLENGAEPCWKCWEYDDFAPLAATEPNKQEEILIGITTSPNPFTTDCRIEFEIDEDYSAESISIQIYDTFGQLVTQIDGQNLIKAGKFQWDWNGENSIGVELPSGAYFLNIKTATMLKTIKIIKL